MVRFQANAAPIDLMAGSPILQGKSLLSDKGVVKEYEQSILHGFRCCLAVRMGAPVARHET
jgi:hypothetical protein